MKSLIGAIQVGGGIWGLGICALSVFSGSYLMLIGLPFFVLSILAGYFLLKGKKHGKALSLLNQALQVLKIQGLGIFFYYYSGLGLYLSFGSSLVGFNSKFGGGVMFGVWNSPVNRYSINVLALLFIVILITRKKKNEHTTTGDTQ